MNNTSFSRLVPVFLLLFFLLPACSSGNILSGGSWQAAGLQGRPLRALAVDQNHPTILYAGDAQGQLFFSSDSGLHWSVRNTGLPPANPTPPLSWDSAAKKIYAATTSALYVSSDAAPHWLSVTNADLPADSV